jgi:flagella basal body P-ring formation protein FlgA
MMILLLTLIFNTFIFSQNSEDQIQKYLNSHFSGYDKVEYQLISKTNINDIVIDFSRALIQKSDMVFLPVLTKDERNNSSVIRLKIKLFKNVLTAKADIPFNKSLSDDDFNYQLKDVTKLRGTLVDKEIELTNYKTKFSLRKDEVLVLESIEEIPAVKSGEKLVLEVQKGAVKISYEGIARQNGKIGEIIDVLAANNELLKAKVISSQKVLVE